jgi:hypothetical protein
MRFKALRRPGFWLLVLSTLGILQPLACQADEKRSSEPAERDGAHDFDFNFGTWKTHIKRRVHPLSGSNEFMEMNGTVTTRKVWGGRAWLEEIEADGPKGHWQGLTLFLYNPQARQWSQAFFDSATVAPSPPVIGSFRNGRGELFAQDTLDGRSILVRDVWSNITPDSHQYEESYSDDGGSTWEAVFTATLTRLSQGAEPSNAAAPAGVSPRDSGHEFDFDFGNWNTHSSRLLHPLTGSTTWADMDGHTIVTKIWGGRANLAEYKAKGPAGEVELLSLRLYNPVTRQWSLNFATPGGGALGIPGIGKFRNGRGDFYDQETINGKAVLVRFSIWGITADTGQSEQAFSSDGGKTWEVNWINRYTRATERP